jgi:hypothetical protein
MVSTNYYDTKIHFFFNIQIKIKKNFNYFICSKGWFLWLFFCKSLFMSLFYIIFMVFKI